MRSMKSSLYRYARRQAHREFNRALYKGNRNIYANYKTKNEEFTSKDFVVGVYTILGILIFLGYIFR
jgi:hypothetical protein